MAKVLWLEESELADPNQGFFELGMDSITVIQMMTHLKSHLGRTLPPTLAFEYPNPERLASHLLSEVLQMETAVAHEASDSRSEEAELQLMEDIRNLAETDLKALIDGELNGLIQGE
jgi:acyl carrier protein